MTVVEQAHPEPLDCLRDPAQSLSPSSQRAVVGTLSAYALAIAWAAMTLAVRAILVACTNLILL